MNHQTRNTIETFFSSNTATTIKELCIPPCELIINQEITLDCTPTCKRCNRSCCNRRNCNRSSHCPKPRDNVKKPQQEECDVTDLNKSDVIIPPCTPFLEDNIQANIDDGKLLQLKINLVHICPNRPLLIGIILCNDNGAFAIKAKKICLRCSRCNKCRCHVKTCTSECFEFLLPDCIFNEKITIKLISEYLC